MSMLLKKSKSLKKTSPHKIIYKGFVFEKVKKPNGKYLIKIYAEDVLKYTSKDLGPSTVRYIMLKDDIKDTILKPFVKEYEKSSGNKRKNPGESSLDAFISSLDDPSKKVDTGAMGVPQDANEAFALGRIAGLKRGLELCEKWHVVTKWWQRRQLKKKIREDMDRWFDSLNLMVSAQKGGIIGAAIPRVRAVGKGVK
jgi:hypothetical protein